MKPTACPGEMYFFHKLAWRCSGGIHVQRHNLVVLGEQDGVGKAYISGAGNGNFHKL